MSRTLNITQNALYLIGCQYLHRERLSKWYSIYRVIALLLISDLLIPLIIYVLGNDVEWDNRAQSLATLSSAFIIVWKVLFVHNKRHLLEYVLSTILSDVDNGHFFNKNTAMWAKRISNLFATVNFGSFIITSLAYYVIPMAKLIIQAVRGTYTTELLAQEIPVKMSYPINLDNAFAFIVIFMWEASYAIYCVATFMAFDSLFIGVCVFGIAYVNDMAELLEYADSEYLRTSNGYSLKIHLIKAVRKHMHYQRLIVAAKELFSGMIFVQFAIGSLLVSMFVYQMQTTVGENGLINLFVSGSLLAQMFIYCFAATKLTSKLVSTCDRVYCINWYAYPVKLQPFVAVLIHQLQTPQYIRGLGFFDCSLETFVVILRFIGSMSAVLQSMK